MNERAQWKGSIERTTFEKLRAATAAARPRVEDILIDSSGCTPMSGTLLLQIGKTCVEKYYFLIDSTLLCADAQDSNIHEVKETLCCNLIRNCVVNDEILSLNLAGGESFTFKTSSVKEANKWCRALQERAIWAKAQNEGNHLANMCGWVKKKHGSSLFDTYKDRYLRIEGKFLRYYKHKDDKEEMGSINIEAIDAIRPYSLKPDCKTFELVTKVFSYKKVEESTFLMETNSSNDMKLWIKAIETVRNGIIQKSLEKEEAKKNATKSFRIKLFDTDGEKAFVKIILVELEAIFPSDVRVIDSMSLREQMEHADQVRLYLEAFIEEARADSPGKPRYDVMSCIMEEVNVLLSFRMISSMQRDSPQLSEASLVDIHALIVWLTKYKNQLHQIFIPASLHRPGTTHCGLFDSLPILCERYVSGNPDGQGGAASHLVDHCLKVWELLLKNPGEMLQRHNDGSFYTFVPLDTWEALHSHLHLAAETKSPILHVIISNKIAVALIHVITIIKEFVESSQIDDDPQFGEMKIEFLCALANDNAQHIEEVISVVENFDMDEIRDRVNDIFDNVTACIVACGQACLKKLAGIIMNDVKPEVDKVFTNVWVDSDGEDDPIGIVIATAKDYMEELCENLMPFWTKKFVYVLLESLIIDYTRAIVFRKEMHMDVQLQAPVKKNVSSPGGTQGSSKKKSGGFFGFGRKKSIAETDDSEKSMSGAMGGAPLCYVCKTEPEVLGKVAQDVNALNKFFRMHSEEEDTQLFLSLIGEVQELLVLPIEKVTKHTMARITEYPSSAQAVHDLAMACIKLRDDIDEEELAESQMMLLPALQHATELAHQYEVDGVVEGQLGLLYLEVVPHSAQLAQSGKKGNKMSQKLRHFANIPLLGRKRANSNNSDDGGKSKDEARQYELARRRSLAIKAGTDESLVDDLVEILHEEEAELMLQAEKAEERRLEEEFERQRRVIHFEGTLEKKNPNMSIFQSKFVKLTTRELQDEEGRYTYTHSLLWFNKEGDPVQGSLIADNIASMRILDSYRPLVYSITTETLMLESDLNASHICLPVFLYGTWYTHRTFKGFETGLLAGKKLDSMGFSHDGDADENNGDSYKRTMKSLFKAAATPIAGSTPNTSSPTSSNIENAEIDNSNQGQGASNMFARQLSEGLNMGSQLVSTVASMGENMPLMTEQYRFEIVMDDSTTFEWRTNHVNDLIRWINTLSVACEIMYDEDAKCWNHEAKAKNERLRRVGRGNTNAEAALQHLRELEEEVLQFSLQHQERESNNFVTDDRTSEMLLRQSMDASSASTENKIKYMEGNAFSQHHDHSMSQQSMGAHSKAKRPSVLVINDLNQSQLPGHLNFQQPNLSPTFNNGNDGSSSPSTPKIHTQPSTPTLALMPPQETPASISSSEDSPSSHKTDSEPRLMVARRKSKQHGPGSPTNHHSPSANPIHEFSNHPHSGMSDATNNGSTLSPLQQQQLQTPTQSPMLSPSNSIGSGGSRRQSSAQRKSPGSSDQKRYPNSKDEENKPMCTACQMS